MKIAITDKVHSLLVNELRSRGHDVIYDTDLNNDSLAQLLPSLDGVVINSKIKMKPSMIDLGEKLKFIGRLGSGMEIIDVPYAKSKNIACINTPDGNCDAVAEHVIGMLLCLSNNIITANAETKQGIWNREANRGFELMCKTIGIVGIGHTGGALARKLKGFGMQIIAYDKYKDRLDEDLNHVRLVDHNFLKQEADIISFHLPLTEETRSLVTNSYLEQCKDGVIIINTARGEILNTGHLIEFLDRGKIAGACLDVFENERISSFTDDEKKIYNRLACYKNVIMTPHIAGWTHESLHRIASLMLHRILATIGS
jgi:D-3-phosphoglycerate dehydrogenase